MSPSRRPIRLLLAEDDPDDQLLIREALSESRIANQLDVVCDGEELLDDGQEVDACVPDCESTGKECGPDGCGGTCGTCPAYSA